MSHQPTDQTPTAGETVAAWLEQIAAQLRTLPEGTPPLSVNIGIQPFGVNRTSSERLATVRAVASALGTDAEPREMSDGTWHLHAEPAEDMPAGCWLRIATYCAVPAPGGGGDDE